MSYLHFGLFENIKYNYNYSFGSLGCQRDYWNSEGLFFPSVNEHKPKKRMKFGKFTYYRLQFDTQILKIRSLFTENLYITLDRLLQINVVPK